MQGHVAALCCVPGASAAAGQGNVACLGGAEVGQVAGQITGSFSGNDLFLNLEIRSARYVPEPSTALPALVGVGLLVVSRRRRA